MKNLLILIYIFLNISRCGSCKDTTKTICGQSNTLFLPQEIKDRFFFKDSTYWIYKDSASGQLDSCWVENSLIGVGENSKVVPTSKGKCFEAANYRLLFTRQGEQKIQIEPTFSKLETNLDDENFFISIKEKNNNFSFTRFKYNRGNIDSINFEGGKIKKINKININSKPLFDIIYVYYSSSSVDIFKDIYYSNKIGIVKYKDKNERVWELIKYAIKQ